MRRSKQTIQIEVFATYMAMIRASVGSRLFQHLFATVDGKKKDLLRNGELSCAMFVSAILLQCRLIHEPHATVAGTIRDLRRSGWKRITIPRPGCVLHWSRVSSVDGEMHEHLGFFLGGSRAVSTSSTKRVPVIHHWTYGRQKGKPRRSIAALYWHPKLVP